MFWALKRTILNEAVLLSTLNILCIIWASAWDFQQFGMCDQQRLRPACAYAQTDQSLCLSLEYSMTVELLTEHCLEFRSLTGGCTGSSESTLVKMSNCWKSRAAAHICFDWWIRKSSHFYSQKGLFFWIYAVCWKTGIHKSYPVHSGKSIQVLKGGSRLYICFYDMAWRGSGMKYDQVLLRLHDLIACPSNLVYNEDSSRSGHVLVM